MDVKQQKKIGEFNFMIAISVIHIHSPSITWFMLYFCRNLIGQVEKKQQQQQQQLEISSQI